MLRPGSRPSNLRRDSTEPYSRCEPASARFMQSLPSFAAAYPTQKAAFRRFRKAPADLSSGAGPPMFFSAHSTPIEGAPSLRPLLPQGWNEPPPAGPPVFFSARSTPTEGAPSLRPPLPQGWDEPPPAGPPMFFSAHSTATEGAPSLRPLLSQGRDEPPPAPPLPSRRHESKTARDQIPGKALGKAKDSPLGQ